MSRRPATRATAAEHDDPPIKPKDQTESKQALLLSEDTGHFSLVKAMHLADAITALNGKA